VFNIYPIFDHVISTTEEISREKSKSESLESSQAQLSEHFERRSAAWINEQNNLNAQIKNDQISLESLFQSKKADLQITIKASQDKTCKQLDNISTKTTIIGVLQAQFNNSLKEMDVLAQGCGLGRQNN